MNMLRLHEDTPLGFEMTGLQRVPVALLKNITLWYNKTET